MSSTPSTGPVTSGPVPVDEAQLAVIARAWHTLSEHASFCVPLGGPSCNCAKLAPRLAQVLDWMTRDADTEPTGVGAVVTSAANGDVFVRCGHPAYPWIGPENPTQQWESPATGTWFNWTDLRRDHAPLLVQSEGWDPPPVAPDPPAEVGTRT